MYPGPQMLSLGAGVNRFTRKRCTMKAQLAFGAVLFACVAFAAIPETPAAAPGSQKVSGDYVEARTASVFAGACHYNGELVTTGEEAIAGWNVTSGYWKGANLTGVKAM